MLSIVVMRTSLLALVVLAAACGDDSASPSTASTGGSGSSGGTAAPTAPMITTQPESQSVDPGQSATFSVVATGTAPLSYQWSLNGTAIGGATASSYATGPTSIAESGGSYAVTVSNAAGSLTSGNALLTVANSTPFGHVVIVLEENANLDSVVGSSEMPYLNSLIADYGLATQYYANTHPSIGNYFMLTTGQILTDDDSETPASFPVSVDNIARELSANNKTWKAYAEALPYAGYTGGDTGLYAVRHVPFAYFTDVQDSASGRARLVPFTQFAADLAAGTLPNFSFVTPDLCNDAHNCALSVADKWLETNIAPLLASAPFEGDGVLIITFDESGNDDTDGGGRVATVVVSPAFSKHGYQSAVFYQHQSTLRLMLEGLGVSTLPGSAATAPDMWQFFTFPTPTDGAAR
jgi:hypothetical protein